MESNNNLNEITAKRHVSGKYYYSTHGSKRWQSDAETCLKQAIKVSVIFDKEQFLVSMQALGVPDHVINAYLENTTICDEIYVDDAPW
jgi:hypothetical protein